MATTFDQIEIALNEVAQKISMNRDRLDKAESGISGALSNLSAMPALYAEKFSDLDQAAAAFPQNVALQATKARKDLYVSEFQSLQGRATALRNAIQNAG